MPYRLRHHGKNPEDERLFSGRSIEILRECASDLCWLLSRGYPSRASLKIAGDRYRLSARQILAVERSVCSDEDSAARAAKLAVPEDCRGQVLMVDGFNVLITVETLLSGGLVFKARDGAYRDIAGIHGTYRKVEETADAVGILCDVLRKLRPAKIVIVLDRPVSNSGRLRRFIEDRKEQFGPPLDVVLCDNPDRLIVESEGIAVSSDSWILDHCARWLNFTALVLADERFGRFRYVQL